MAKKKKDTKKKKKRVDYDISSKGPWVSNFDYGGSEEGSDVGPGRGLYNGPMDKYKSVEEWRKKKDKRPHSRKFALMYIIELIARGEAGG